MTFTADPSAATSSRPSTAASSGPLFFPADALERAERKSLERDARIVDRIHYWQHRLGLVDWEIRYDPHGDPAPLYFAAVSARLEERVAQVEIDRDLPDESLDLVLAHELLHVVLKRYEEMVDRLISMLPDPSSGIDTRSMVAGIVEDLQEEAVEQIAQALSGDRNRLYPTGDLRNHWKSFL